jgi:UDP-N-acetylglucosamine 4,6-dehydratase
MTRKLLGIGYQVCVLSRDEAKQAALMPTFPAVKWMIGDVRDRARVRRAVRGCDLVIHAAALKRIEVGALNPGEMLKTNVNGTQNVVEEAEDMGIRCVVLSTDKAWQPCSPYGQSKALAESLALASGAAVVRYGNVSGSTGSIIPTWRAMGDTVPVTNPECTRFWMWEWEAVEFVLATAERMPAEVQTPDWLPAYRVGDLAQAMGKQMNIVGLPAHEKLHEGMRDGVTSDKARRMTVEELKESLTHV